MLEKNDRGGNDGGYSLQCIPHHSAQDPSLTSHLPRPRLEPLVVAKSVGSTHPYPTSPILPFQARPAARPLLLNVPKNDEDPIYDILQLQLYSPLQPSPTSTVLNTPSVNGKHTPIPSPTARAIAKEKALGMVDGAKENPGTYLNPSPSLLDQPEPDIEPPRQAHLHPPTNHSLRTADPFNRFDVSLVARKLTLPSARPESRPLFRLSKDLWQRLGTIIRCIYLCFFLRLPVIYQSRVHRIFADVNISMPMIIEMALQVLEDGRELHREGRYSEEELRSFTLLKASWDHFISSLLKDWKVTNVVSALLLNAAFAMLQIDEIREQFICEHLALASLVSSLMSLLYGWAYIMKFHTMRRTHKAAQWAEETQTEPTSFFWNVWIFLSMPLVWLVWSLIYFLAAIMFFVWSKGQDASAPSEGSLIAFRAYVSMIFAMGAIYFANVLKTLRHYGSQMDKAWKERMKKHKGSNISTSNTQGRSRKSQDRIPELTPLLLPNTIPTANLGYSAMPPRQLELAAVIASSSVCSSPPQRNSDDQVCRLGHRTPSNSEGCEIPISCLSSEPPYD